MDFYSFVLLLGIACPDSPVADLASDMKASGNFPRYCTKEEGLTYLRANGSCDECIETFNSLYDDYEHILGRGRI